MKTYSCFTDSELTTFIHNGDRQAFTELYNRYWEQVLYFAIQKTSDIGVAEDIVQDVFVSLWKRKAELEISSEFKNYLIVSIKYRVLRFLSRERTKRLAEESNMLDYDVLDDSTQQYLDFEELQTTLQEMISKLPERSALIYRMNKEDGMSHRDIAKEMGMSEKAVNASLVRTKKVLRAGLNTFLTGFLL
ncbi:RNA polymerase sigma-70 factor [Pedobacter nyackensis]|uniref:RNA polymerase sigma-70 factor n=1 Tax=Pedobacter nyackensis TaxID=475255 RepID=UPI00292FE574|nr:RNA polymerase sigma-70 factor [Pedobacter nyackensis]